MMRVRFPRSCWGLVLTALVGACLFVTATGAEDGSSDCAMCHENISRTFETTVHGRIAGFEVRDGQTGCITCHGDGTEHVDAGGDASLIQGFGDVTEVEATAEMCQSCHRSNTLHDWAGSSHALNGVGCADCHDVHAAPGQIARVDLTCMGCHEDVEAQYRYPSHHPVMEGHMSCLSCHAPHGTSLGMLKTEERPQELCYDCHAHLQGPFIFEHEPVFEGCDSCHAPHGAVANNLLVQNEPFLCLECHEMHFHAGLEGEEPEEWYIPAFDPAVPIRGRTDRPGDTYPDGLLPNPNGESAWKQAFTTKCTQCHTHVHGTDSPSQTVPGQGGGLMR